MLYAIAMLVLSQRKDGVLAGTVRTGCALQQQVASDQSLPK